MTQVHMNYLVIDLEMCRVKKLELNPEYEIAKYALPESDEHLSCTIGDLFAGSQLKFG